MCQGGLLIVVVLTWTARIFLWIKYINSQRKKDSQHAYQQRLTFFRSGIRVLSTGNFGHFLFELVDLMLKLLGEEHDLILVFHIKDVIVGLVSLIDLKSGCHFANQLLRSLEVSLLSLVLH